MKKFLFTILSYFCTITSLWALAITCTYTGDTDCKISEMDKVTTIKSCADIKGIDDSTILRYPYEMLEQCKDRENDEYKNKTCPYVAHAYVKAKISSPYNDNYDIIAFCITNKDVVLEYTDDETTRWSYNQKKCVGSGGTWTNNSCDCSKLNGTQSIDNECLCQNNKQQKYFGKLYSGCNTLKNGVTAANGKTIITGFGKYDLSTIDKVNSCAPSGGEWGGPDKNTCSCKENLNMVLDSSGYFCNCKSNYQYKNPLRKSQGCVSINDTISISGNVTDTARNPLKDVNVYVADNTELRAFTDGNGNYTLNDIPNTAQISFSLQGYETKTIMVDYLSNNNQTIVLQTANPDNNTDTPKTPNQCTKTGGSTNDDGKNCTCPDGFAPHRDDEQTEYCVAKEPDATDSGINNDINAAGVYAESENTPQSNTDADVIKKLQDAQSALDAARDKENSLANKLLTGASTAATGIGAMQAASAIAEQRADRNAERDMRQYITTMQCEYGDGKIINVGNTDVTLPGGNELLEYYSEYKSLADNLKTTKSALGLRSGIESEVLYDRAQSGLYQYASIGKTGGAETSLYRALTDKESEDASAWAEQKEKSAKQLTTGGLVAAAGFATGVIGNYLVNERGNKNDTNETDIDEIAARAGSALGRNRNNNKQSNESAPTAKAAAKTTPVAQAQNHSGTEQSDETNPTGKPSDKNVQGPLEQKKSCDEIIKAMQDAACNTKGLEAYDYSGHVKPECLDKIYIACDGLKNLSCSNSSLSPIATTNYGYSIGQSDAREDNNGFWCTFKRDRSNTTPEKSNSYDQSKLTDYQKHVRAQYDKYSIACGPNRTQQIELLAQDDYKSNIYKKLEKECSDAGGDFLTMVEDKKSTGTVIYNCHALECN